MTIVGVIWFQGIIFLSGFSLGVWVGTKNGKRIAHVDGRFDELVRQANEYSREQAARNTSVDMSRERNPP